MGSRPVIGRIYRVIAPDATYSGGTTLTGGYTEYEYDTRGNVTRMTVVPKDAVAGVAKNLVTTAVYPATCPATDLKFCNKPTSVTDVNGLTTTYEYDLPDPAFPNTTGSYMLKKVTLPNVVNPGAIPDGTPEVRYSYRKVTPRQYEKPGSIGTLTADTPVWRLAQISTCNKGTAATCINSVDEARTTFSYGTPDSDGNFPNPTHNNVLPVSVTTSTGDGSDSLTTAFTYDAMGRVVSTDGPLSGTNDTTYTFYNRAGWVLGTIGADPDGGSALKRKAVKYTYDNDGKVTKTDYGVASGTAVSNLPSGSNIYETVATEYDTTSGLPKFQRYFAKGSATAQQVTRTTYDSLFRVDCVTVAASDPQACGAGAGAAPDRIVKYNYDRLGRILNSVSGYGTAQARSDVVKTYNPSGTVASVADDKGNLTGYTYDNFNRLIKTCYPETATPLKASSTDCAEVEFNTANTANAARATNLPSAVNLRGHSVSTPARFDLTYDVLKRLQTRVGPTGSGIDELIYYNNFNQILSHKNNGFTSVSTYHALFGIASQTQPTGRVRTTYDAVGRRTRLYYDDANTFFVSYAYRSDNSLSTIRTGYNGAGTIVRATFTPDDYGRLEALALGPSSEAVTDPVYDTASRLSTLTNNLSGSANDVTWTYGYNNATNQIASRTSNNSAYNFTPLANVGPLTYGHNGLNQMTSAGAASYNYDARGNLTGPTGTGQPVFTYNLDNLLTGYSDPPAGYSTALTYDTQNRLSSVAKTVSAITTTNKFLYDGPDLIAEFDGSGNLLRRYVHGPSYDQPLVWFEGSNDSTPKYFVADQQGSITAVTDSTGVKLTSHSYDAYGIPSATGSRFLYTGQVHLPEVGGLYYYKARMYQPAIGRFLQADPIGYGDGMNMYVYVGNDPVNMIDPFGLNDLPLCEPNVTCGPGYIGVEDDIDVYGPGMARDRDEYMRRASWAQQSAYIAGLKTRDSPFNNPFSFDIFDVTGALSDTMLHPPPGRCEAGDQAAAVAKATGWGEKAQNLLADGLGKLDEGAGNALKPVAGIFSIVSVGSTVYASHQRGEPIDVTLARAGLPLAGSYAFGRMFATAGTAVGGVPGGVVGAAFGGAGGDMIGEHVAGRVAEARGYSYCP